MTPDLYQLIQSLPAELDAEIIQGELSATAVSAITCDSRKVQQGSLFVALKGSAVDGHHYVEQALANGCCCVIVEESVPSLSEKPVLRVKDSHKALGLLAAAFYGFPAESMTTIGLTGTNGKTTVSWLIERMLIDTGCRVGVIGTVNYRYPDRLGQQVVEAAPLTTPDPVQLQRLLRNMAGQGVTHLVMECSSHGLAQKRLEGIGFDVAVFTNLSRDHLDFHNSMEEYFSAKKLLFTRYLKKKGRAIIVMSSRNNEEDWGRQLQEQLEKNGRTSVLSCGFEDNCGLHAKELTQTINGFSCQLFLQEHPYRFHSPLCGRYNVLNVLAALGVGVGVGLEAQQLVLGLQKVHRVPGRLEPVRLAAVDGVSCPTIFVDYAHTPDALHNVLQTLLPLTSGRLICVVGCGGDRDRGKRPQMGAIAGAIAQVTILTSDNPRSEDPETIINEIAGGIGSLAQEVPPQDLFTDSVDKGRVFSRITDRKTAIHAGCSLAEKDDIVLIAGKGHEDYQLLGDTRLSFDDRQEAMDGLLSWNKELLVQATGGTVSERQSGLPESLLCSAYPESRRLAYPESRRLAYLPAVSTDTRTLQQGDIFVALAGENFNGHDYLDTAVQKGAKALIVQQPPEKLPEDVLVIRVADTLQALGDMAAFRRQLLRNRLKVIAITGSSGKTTVKEMVSAICAEHLNLTSKNRDTLLKTRGNFNNLIGLPLSLLPVAARHQIAILEMGMNRLGEIERLTEIAAPDIGCITNIQAAHLEGLGTIQGVAQAKGELFSGQSTDSISVVNLDDPLVCRLARRAENSISFAITPAGRRKKPDVRATRIVPQGEAGTRFTLHIKDWKKRITLNSPGIHNVSNAAAAAAIALAADIAPETIISGLGSYQNAHKRMQFTTLPGNIQVLNDCYNANPSSMSAALKTVRGFGSDCHRFALLGDMLELGVDAVALHEQLGSEVAQLGFDQLAVTGSFAEAVARGAVASGMAKEQVHVFPDAPAMAAWLSKEMAAGRIGADDWLLLKGSRGMRMEQVLEYQQPETRNPKAGKRSEAKTPGKRSEAKTLGAEN